MRILFIHNYYQLAGGEDRVVELEMDLLRSYGHEVRLFSVHNDDIVGLKDKLTVALTTHYSNRYSSDIVQVVNEFGPDVAHVHNFFPLLTTKIYQVLKGKGVPVVQTLHNYRMFCSASGTFLRNDVICEKCLHGSAFNAVRYGCYRQSSLASIPVALMVEYNRRTNIWNQDVSQFIALTKFSKSKFVEGGVSENLISVKPNFMESPVASQRKRYDQRSGLVFVGRLSAEKGIAEICEAWESWMPPLTVVGDGPLYEPLKQQYSGRVTFLGPQSKREVLQIVGGALAMIMNSKWYEGFPMVIVEAFSMGTPVIGRDLGSLSEIISDGENGCLLDISCDLRRELKYALQKILSVESWERMSSSAISDFNLKYSADTNYQQIMDVYTKAIGG